MHDTRCLVLSLRNKLKSREHEIAPLYADPIVLLLDLGLRRRLAVSALLTLTYNQSWIHQKNNRDLGT